MSWSIDENNLAFVPDDPARNYSDANLIPVNTDSEANNQANAIISENERIELYSKYTALVGNAFGYLNKILSDISKLPIRRVPYTGGSSFLTGCGGDTGDKCEAYVPGKEDQSIPVSCYADLDGDGHSNGDEADAPEGIIDTNGPVETDNPTETTNPEIITTPDDQDGDGYKVCASPGQALQQVCDCDDTNRGVHPGAIQRFNGIDTNCDGSKEIDPAKDAVIFIGETGGFSAGAQVLLGDVNGDGNSDVIIKGDYSTGEWPDGWNGRIYMFMGGAGKFIPGTSLNLANADVILTGGADVIDNPSDATGWNIGGVMKLADVNQDGIQDIITTVNSYGPQNERGAITVMFGRNNWPSRWDMHGFDIWDSKSLNDQSMALIKGPRPDERPNGLNSDFTMGYNWKLTEWSPNGKEPTLLAGHREGRDSQTTTDVLPLRGLRAGAVIAYHDLVTHQIHSSIDSDSSDPGATDISDADGDGFGDILVGNSREFPESEDNVVFILGAPTLPKNLHVDRLGENADIKWFKFTCAGNQDALGDKVRFADVDGDGVADLIFTDGTMKTYNNDGSILYDSMMYVLPAYQVGLAATGQHPSQFAINVGTNISVIYDFPKLGGYQIAGVNGVLLGWTSATGLETADMNDDGIPELMVHNGPQSPAQNLLFDFTRLPPGTYTSAKAQQSLPWSFKGEVYAGNGDVNGDGVGDFMIGSPSMIDPNNPDQQSSESLGGAYLLFGGH